jgi:hypothetical protein
VAEGHRKNLSEQRPFSRDLSTEGTSDRFNFKSKNEIHQLLTYTQRCSDANANATLSWRDQMDHRRAFPNAWSIPVLAQLVERETVDLQVSGSIPLNRTIFFSFSLSRYYYRSLNQFLHNRQVYFQDIREKWTARRKIVWLGAAQINNIHQYICHSVSKFRGGVLSPRISSRSAFATTCLYCNRFTRSAAQYRSVTQAWIQQLDTTPVSALPTNSACQSAGSNHPHPRLSCSADGQRC